MAETQSPRAEAEALLDAEWHGDALVVKARILDLLERTIADTRRVEERAEKAEAINRQHWDHLPESLATECGWSRVAAGPPSYYVRRELHRLRAQLTAAEERATRAEEALARRT